MKHSLTFAARFVFVAALGCMATVAAGATTAPPRATVTIANDAFAPAIVHVHAGEEVTFVNSDDETHTVTSDTALFDSGRMDEKARYAHTFAKPGTYAYHCAIHTFMKGTIVVDPAKGEK
jgi:plastocyanin